MKKVAAYIENSDVVPATPRACAECPWRVSNHFKPHPGKWYSLANIKRLWRGLRDGQYMTCHPTDTRMNEFPWRPVREGSTAHECAGALVVQQREFMKFSLICDETPDARGRENLRRYRRENPLGLTRDGLVSIAERGLFGGIPLVGGLKMTRPDLNDEEIGHPLLTWKPIKEGATKDV